MTRFRSLAEFAPAHDFFVGIDSDGCAFDSMEIKHKECFTPATIKHWNLQAVSRFAREACEFVNLYSKTRGINRWPALIRTLELLAQRPEAQARGYRLPDLTPLREFVAGPGPHSEARVAELFEQTGDELLKRALGWSRAVNASVDDMVEGVPPFRYLRESLEKLEARADIVVVSATPAAALEKEWTACGIAEHVRMIAGQEFGTKREILSETAADRYATDKALMIGDAPGDRKAAEAVHALFYPINPGAEEASWRRFHDEAIDRFLAGEYAGAYQHDLIEEFESFLPESPPW